MGSLFVLCNNTSSGFYRLGFAHSDWLEIA
jgi:hypothetical protein